MNNFEKYRKKIESNKFIDTLCFIRKLRTEKEKCEMFNDDNAYDAECKCCELESLKWLTEEYKEPEIDWTTIEEGTVVMVRDANASQWSSRYFYFYSYNPLLQYPFIVSDNAIEPYKLTCWKQCKLVER